MLGEADSGKTTVMANTGLNLSFGREAAESHERHYGLNWCFFDNAVVLDVAGELGGRRDDLGHKDRGWNAFLRLLLKYRPQNAVDGVILTIPCTDLMGPPALKAERIAAIRASAAGFYQRLWRAQKVLGMSFPVYILITKCDQITGFNSFCNALPRHLQDNIFGWSNPYTLENSFTSSWLYEAFEEISEQLVQLQLEIFADKESVEDKDDLFFFPSKLQELQSPLQAYLDILFKRSGYHQPFFLRGVYFSGDGADSAIQVMEANPDIGRFLPEETSIDAEPSFPYHVEPETIHTTPVRPAFLKDLFEQKIFQERALARPVFGFLISRNRAVLAAQIAILLVIVVGGLGLTFGYRHLDDREQTLQNLLDKIPNQLRVAHEAQQGLTAINRSRNSRSEAESQDSISSDRYTLGSGQPDLSASRENEKEFISLIRRTDGSSFYSLFIPSSWFSGIDNQVENALTPAFSSILLDSSRMELDNRIDDIVNTPNLRVNYFLVKLNELVRFSRLYGG